MALLNRHVLVQYDVGGPELWHERWALEFVANEEYVVATPDRDIYVEELSVLNSDLRGVRVKPGPNVLPPGIDPNNVYPLPAWNAGDVAALRAEAQRVADAERTRRGAAGGVAGGAQAQGAVPAAAAKVVDPFPAGTLKWLAAEAFAGCVVGQEIPGVAAPMTKDAKAVHALPDGQSLFVQCVDGADLQTFLGKIQEEIAGSWTMASMLWSSRRGLWKRLQL